jgi:hypothetical protein
MATPHGSAVFSNIIRLKIHLLKLRLYLCQAEQENPSPEEQRAEVATPYPQDSSAAENYIDGYLDYQNAAMQLEVPQCRGDRSSY